MIETRQSFDPRYQPRIETRKEGPPVLTGYGAVYYRAEDPGTEYWIWDDLVERIMPGAFAAAVAEGDDARALFNHTVDNLLGLRSAGTLRLFADDVGLRYEIDVPDTSLGRDLVVLVGRGDVPGSSFAFRTDAGARRGNVAWQTVNDGQRVFDVRLIHDLELYDVGPVTRPAYTSTTAGLRATLDAATAEALAAERAAWRTAQAHEDGDEVEVRAALVRATAWLG